ncbi:tail fiber assembly protein [Lonsdalea quercina]|uniref:tail fiber assembly protein n=1 Tax=Lonsdalea quercina TaxID=71657 RepID=UPI0039755563
MKKYAASTNAFYDTDINDVLPDDATEITDEEWLDMLYGQSQGKAITAGSDGKPTLIERVLTSEEILAQAVYKKTSLRAEADSAIAPLQDAVDLGIATDEEAAVLNVWKKYRVLLNRVDTSTAPDIDWPESPSS